MTNLIKTLLLSWLLIKISFGIALAQSQTLQPKTTKLENSVRIFSKDSVQIDPSAILELQSKNKGFAFPLLTSEQRLNITNPDLGLMVYDIDENKIFVFDGTFWQGLEMVNSKDIYSFELYGETGSEFGTSLFLEDKMAFIGARSQSVNGVYRTGAVHYYIKNANNEWVLKQVIKPEILVQDQWFGFAIHYKNDTLVCTGLENAYVFTKNGNGDFVESFRIDKPEYFIETFGKEIYRWGDYIAICGLRDFEIEQGRVYIYKKNGNSWILSQTITTNRDLNLGFSIIMEDGYLFIGNGGVEYNTPIDMNKSRILIYKFQNGQFNYLQDLFETGYDFLGLRLAYYNHKLYSYLGYEERIAINVYGFENNNWSVHDVILLPEHYSQNELAVYGDYVMLGAADYNNDAFGHAGKVFFYKKENNQWLINREIAALDMEFFTYFGAKMSVFKQDYLIGGLSTKKNRPFVVFGRTND